MFRRKMTEQEIRLECAKLSMQGYQQFIPAVAEQIYNYITSSEKSGGVQKKPRGCFFCHLWSKIRSRQK